MSNNVNNIFDNNVTYESLKNENHLLLNQIHTLQIELEKYKSKNKNIATKNVFFSTNESLNSMIENIKLRNLIEQQKYILNTELNNNFSLLLGSAIIKNSNSFKSLISLPIKLLKIWKNSQSNTISKKITGENFEKIYNLYQQCGLKQVEDKLNSLNISRVTKAKIYTELARHLEKVDPNSACNIAKIAYELDPQPYRLKWLAFKMYKASKVITADSLLDLLPQDITMSDWEKKQQIKIRDESEKMRAIKFKHIKTSEEVIESLNREISNQKKLYEKEKERSEQYEEEIGRLKDMITETNKRFESINKINSETISQIKLKEQELQNLTNKTAIILENLISKFKNNNEIIPHIVQIITGK